jgi:hypothetical protein
MSEMDGTRKRRVFRWPPDARQLVRDYQERNGQAGGHNEVVRRVLVTRLAEVSGNPRAACLRFLRQLGITEKRKYRAWTKREQQQLLKLIAEMPVEEVARLLRRPPASVRSMLHRLGIGGRQARDWFTKFSLARALRIRTDTVKKWIDSGWLKCRVVETHGLKIHAIDADSFCEFFKEYGRKVVGASLNEERLRFVCTYVFPPSHTELLSVRGKYKKRGTDGQPSNSNLQSLSGTICGNVPDDGDLDEIP